MKRILLVIALLPAMACAQNAPAAQEKAMIAAIDRFMESQRENYHAYEDMLVESSGQPASVRYQRYRNDPFVTALRKFYADNALAYTQLRQARYALYGAPPPSLLKLRWDSAGVRTDVEEMEGNFDLLAPAFIRTFDPQTVAQVVTSLMTMSAYTGHPGSIRAHYAARARYGMRIYTKRIQPSLWQVWAADRSMALTFLFDFTNGVVQPLARTRLHDPAYANIAWTPTPQHFTDEAEALTVGLHTMLWNSYRAADTVETSAMREARRALFAQYRSAHATRYPIAIRQQLSQLEAPPAMPSGFVEKVGSGDGLLAHADSVENAAMNIYPAQWATTITTAAFQHLNMEKNVVKIVTRNALFPVRRYARRLKGPEWDVMVVYEATAMRFTWNIETGMVRDVRFWLKEGYQY